MDKKLAWDTFKNTGNIEAFLQYKQLDNLEKGIEELEDIQKITNINLNNINNKD